MRLFKATYKNRADEKCKSKKWYLDFSDHLGRRHKIPAFESKKQSDALGRRIEELVSSKFAGQKPDTESQNWLNNLPHKFTQKLVSWGIIDEHRVSGTKIPSASLSLCVKSFSFLTDA